MNLDELNRRHVDQLEAAAAQARQAAQAHRAKADELDGQADQLEAELSLWTAAMGADGDPA